MQFPLKFHPLCEQYWPNFIYRLILCLHAEQQAGRLIAKYTSLMRVGVCMLHLLLQKWIYPRDDLYLFKRASGDIKMTAATARYFVHWKSQRQQHLSATENNACVWGVFLLSFYLCVII